MMFRTIMALRCAFVLVSIRLGMTSSLSSFSAVSAFAAVPSTSRRGRNIASIQQQSQPCASVSNRPTTTTRLQQSATTTSSSSSNNNNNNSNNKESDAVQEPQPLSLASRLNNLDKPTVWHEFTPLATEYDSINLGQGFPDWDPPEFVIEAMKRSTMPSYGRHANQYARPNGHLPLTTVLAEDYTNRFHRPINPQTQIATAVGCTNVLYCALQGLINPGDEVVMLEPAFDIYTAQVQMAGGTPIYCPLRPSKDPATVSSASQHFTLDLEELESHLTHQTKILLLNTPHNPTGKMLSRPELDGITNLLQNYPQVVVLSDEVYEHIVFDPTKEPHVSPATIDGLQDKTLTLSSSGKTFSCTGWKVGWAIGPEHLIKAVTAVQQWVNFSTPTPNQDAIAQALVEARNPYKGHNTFYDYLAADYLSKRDLLVNALESAGMTPIIPPGGFFIMADTTNIEFDYDANEITEAMPTSTEAPRDWALSRWLTQQVGVTAIPPSAFYSTPNVPLAQNLLRFAFCKDQETIREAGDRLQKYFLKVATQDSGDKQG